jgi:hypothetical protein
VIAKTHTTVLSLAELLRGNPQPQPAFVEPGLLPRQGILFVGGEPKVGKSLLVANLALALASGSARTGFQIPNPQRVLICQFELPTDQFAARLLCMRQSIGAAADENLFVDTRSCGHLLSSTQGLRHFLAAARVAEADVIVLDPLYSAHDQDENDTRAMAALCHTLLRLRDASRAALIVVHHVRKSVSRHEIGSAFRGSSALHAVGDTYMLMTHRGVDSNTVELRFQLRYAAPLQPKSLALDPGSLWFSPSDEPIPRPSAQRKVDTGDVRQAILDLGNETTYSELRQKIMNDAACSRRTAQLAIKRAFQNGVILRNNGQYRLPF